ncbi:MAG: VOC family protein [Methylobacteriaceae bacterium]|nr:VOC family protein [Methylobacteriaceae bacterium]
MSARLGLVTLGVSDVPASRRFYEALGFRASAASQGDVVFFAGPGPILALYPRARLAEDAGLPPGGAGFGGVALAINVADEAEVDALIATALGAGAQALRPAGRVFWGGYSGYFADPDGHVWEVAHNPFFPLDADGLPRLPA